MPKSGHKTAFESPAGFLAAKRDGEPMPNSLGLPDQDTGFVQVR